MRKSPIMKKEHEVRTHLDLRYHGMLEEVLAVDARWRILAMAVTTARTTNATAHDENTSVLNETIVSPPLGIM